MKNPRAVLRPLTVAALLGAAGCVGVVGQRVSPERDAAGMDVPEITNTPLEIRSLALEIEERAASRIKLGTMRLLVEDFEEVSTRRVRTSAAGAPMLQEDAAAVAETLRAELMLSLGNRVNVVDPDLVSTVGDGADPAARRRASGATHALVGTWTRSGDAVDVTARLVHLGDGWIVATAQRRIHRFRALRATAAESAPLPAATIARAPGTVAGGDPDAGGEAVDLMVDPGVDGGTAPVIPEDAVIEFREGPAAARLGRGKPRKPD